MAQADYTTRVKSVFGTTDVGSTDWLRLAENDKGGRNFFDLSVQATNDGTFQVDLERKRPDEADASARIIESYTADAEKIGEIHGGWDIRLTIPTGGHTTSGDITLELSID